jgi:hypothetical protein
LLVAMGALAWGCAVEAADATVYETCRDVGNTCKDGSRCVEVYCCGGGQCTATCAEDGDCPPLAGYHPICEIFPTGRYCVIACAGRDDDCPDTYRCERVERRDRTKVDLCL